MGLFVIGAFDIMFFVIGYRLRSLRFVRGGETNEPYPRARFYHYSGCYSRNYLVFRLQMARW